MKVVELLEAPADGSVQFVLVGGMAVQLHGFMRSTFVPVSINALRNPTHVDRWYREQGMLAFALREPNAGGMVADILVRPEVPFEALRGCRTRPWRVMRAPECRR